MPRHSSSQRFQSVCAGAARRQATLAESVSVEGYGLWSGRDVRVQFQPADVDSGVVFVRDDLDPPMRISAVVSNRIEMPLRTTLADGGVTVEMVEHVLAAVSGLQIDNCEIHVNGPELPGCDGSSLAFVDALKAGGTVLQGAMRPQLVVTDPTRVGNDDVWVEALPSTFPGLSLKGHIDYGRDSAIGRQTLELNITPDVFSRELASARTFIMRDEAEWLMGQGLGQRTTPQDLLVFDDMGPIENDLRFPNECVRHKMLDLLGDLALAGCDLVGRFVAHRSGHRWNVELVRALLAEGQIVQPRSYNACG